MLHLDILINFIYLQVLSLNLLPDGDISVPLVQESSVYGEGALKLASLKIRDCSLTCTPLTPTADHG